METDFYASEAGNHWSENLYHEREMKIAFLHDDDGHNNSISGLFLKGLLKNCFLLRLMAFISKWEF